MATSLGEYFKELRKKINVSQVEMAKFLSLEQSSISRFENGERALSLSSIEKACLLFGIPTEELFKMGETVETIAPKFRKSSTASDSLDDISSINKIALNLMEMKKILENADER